MRTHLTIAALAAALILPLAMNTPAQAAPKGCPPGLAKKHNGCTPPGLSGQRRGDDDRHYRDGDRYRIGDRIRDGYVVIRDPSRYGLASRGTYYRSGDYVYRVDRETREVLDFIGAFARLVD
ncbi:hypothetical protein [Salipiger mucosus]|uniref:Excinuclease ABC subunit A n=1 Tax=Salipiger mucosus DSM 16094 TaxID=1123237 RepID=S9RPZ7_9RHOB|nr:hypothetical protein [Salipiger mucosus]EPX76079.1 hypothetical protein Salmuc_00732 [Salipiger mucosus DSM 16094]